MPQRLVITGAGGMVGRILTAQARRQGRDVLALTSADCDITDPEAVAGAIARGDVVVNCAALADVDRAESEPERAHAVNATAPGHLATVCARIGAGLIHLSTDYVFSGEFGAQPPRPYDIDDAPDPLSVYGRSKLAGERAVLDALPQGHVVRTAWVYEGADGADFVSAMRRKALGTETVDVVADQIGSPTSALDLVAALLEIADGTVHGPLLHAANDGQASRFDQARAVFEAVGADPERVRPVGSDRFPRPARRPVYSALSGAGSAACGLTALRPWREALVAALETAFREGR
jgi:dTDP-4-dehydrorhamnose reductase